MKDLAYLNKFFLKYKWRLIPGVIFVIIANLFAVLPAQVIRTTFNLVSENIAIYRLFIGFERQAIVLQLFGYSVLFFGVVVLLLALIRGLFLFFMRQTIILMSRHIEYDLKNEIYSHYQSLSLAFFRKNTTGDLMNRVTEDVSRVRMYLGPAIMYSINTAVLFLLVIYAMVTVNLKLAILSLLPLPFLALTIYLVNNIINSRSERIQVQLSNLSSFVQETFSGIRLIKAYVRENEVAGRFTESSLNYQRNSMDLVKVQALFYPIMLLLVGLSTIITVYVGGFEVINGHITAGNIAEFVVYVTQLTFPVMSLGWVTSLIQRAAASQKRINEFLHTEPEIKSGQTEVQLKGNIQFKNVSFTYPDTGIQALKNVNFELKQGELLAIIGKTGSGKSTLANLLMRMYDVQAGEICVEEQPIKNLNLIHYRSQIGFVPQEVFLFSDTIANNIAFGCSATLPEIETAAKQAAVHENINTFEKGYQTLLGERGITLSGGQKQRVSIARALVKQPSLLILDDSLSAVDTRTEEQILRNLDSYTQHSTTLIIAHRISSIKQANQILVLDGGEIIESGNHTQLLSKKGYYYELYQKQLLDEERTAH
ncbi:MAG: ABC transporter ATP-binding protein/permease [Sphingobacteriaceae bacterium]|nr:ABC transporter ATP-binding protein/permease [Sphingobacteriaceae bacterium]